MIAEVQVWQLGLMEVCWEVWRRGNQQRQASSPVNKGDKPGILNDIQREVDWQHFTHITVIKIGAYGNINIFMTQTASILIKGIARQIYLPPAF